MIPHVALPVWPAVRPDRFAARIRTDDPAGCRIALLGLPDDTGVRLNGGRPGAAEGPRVFRAALAAYGSAYDGEEEREIEVPVFDAGDVVPVINGGDLARVLAETHERVTEAAEALHRAGLTVFAVGGGHDLTFPTVRALARIAGAPVGGMNVDPHLDVRDTIGSGMPFRSLIEGGHVDPERFVEFGAGRFANAREHVEWARSRGVTILGMDKVLEHRSAINVAFERISRGRPEPAFVSFDLDAIDGAHAPGVSSPCPMGIGPADAARIARRAGAHPSVRHFDLMELCPPNDDPPSTRPGGGVGRTARVAATLFLSFVGGFAERPE